MRDSGTEGKTQMEPTPPVSDAERRRDAALERVGQEMLAGRSPRQTQLANTVYRRLKDGARVEDVKHLIDDLSRVATEDFRRRAREGK